MSRQLTPRWEPWPMEQALRFLARRYDSVVRCRRRVRCYMRGRQVRSIAVSGGLARMPYSDWSDARIPTRVDWLTRGESP